MSISFLYSISSLIFFVFKIALVNAAAQNLEIHLGDNEKWGLKNKNECVVLPIYSNFIRQNDKLDYKDSLPPELEVYFGLISMDGKVVLPFQHKHFDKQFKEGHQKLDQLLVNQDEIFLLSNLIEKL